MIPSYLLSEAVPLSDIDLMRDFADVPATVNAGLRSYSIGVAATRGEIYRVIVADGAERRLVQTLLKNLGYVEGEQSLDLGAVYIANGPSGSG